MRDDYSAGRFNGHVETEAEAFCPHCGEAVTIGLDPGGGALQDYVEDCEICCRPRRIRLRYDRHGEAAVDVVALD